MKKFLIKVVFFSLITFVFLYALDVIITNGLRKNKSNFYISWNDIFNGDASSDLIVNGSSIAELHISPKILDSVLNLKSYNLGISGYSFLMQKAKYNTYLKHNASPKIIVQIVGDITLIKKKGLFQKSQFLPYLKDSIIRSTTKEYDGFNILDYNLPLFRYSGNLKPVLKGVGSFFGLEPIHSIKYKGFLSNDIPWDGKFEKFKKNNPNGVRHESNPKVQQSFENYISETVSSDKIVFLVFPPTYHELEKYMLGRQDFIKYYKNISEKHTNVLYLDYSSDKTFTQRRELFYNSMHLNSKGASLFSKKLAIDIKKYLEKI